MQLQRLELPFNKLGAVPACVAQMARLHTLDLRSNPSITSLPAGPYRSSLRALNLAKMMCVQGEDCV